MTQLNQENLKKLETLFKMMTESLTKDDFVKAFEALTKVVLQTEKTLIAKIDQKTANAEKDLENLENEFRQVIQNARSESDSSLGSFKQRTLEMINSWFLKNRANSKLTEILDNYSQKMSLFDTQINQSLNKIDKKISEIKDGNTPTETELLALIKPLIPLPVKGDKGNDGVIEDIKDIREDIKELKEDMKKQKSRVFGGGIVGRDLFKDIDISSQLDGATKTFNIQAVWRIISVDLSSFPYGSLRKTADYTWTPTSITFTNQIDAATQLSAGSSCIITAVLA